MLKVTHQVKRRFSKRRLVHQVYTAQSEHHAIDRTNSASVTIAVDLFRPAQKSRIVLYIMKDTTSIHLIELKQKYQ